jgi:hypothetical protein
MAGFPLISRIGKLYFEAIPFIVSTLKIPQALQIDFQPIKITLGLAMSSSLFFLCFFRKIFCSDSFWLHLLQRCLVISSFSPQIGQRSPEDIIILFEHSWGSWVLWSYMTTIPSMTQISTGFLHSGHGFGFNLWPPPLVPPHHIRFQAWSLGKKS